MASVSVLIIDDNRNMRLILRTVLRGFGIAEVAEASDGAEALSLMRERGADLIITDFRMSPIDGVEFVRMLRRSSDSPDQTVPVIMVTGHPSRELISHARDAGVDELLAKPISAAALQERMSAIFHRRRSFVRTQSYFGPDRRRFRGPRQNIANPRRASDKDESVKV